MRNIFLLIALTAAGCVNDSASVHGETLRQSDTTREDSSSATVVSPVRTPSLDLEVNEEIVDLPYDYISTCVCEYQGWHENGLICLGIRCTPECSSEVTSCNERRRACVPDM